MHNKHRFRVHKPHKYSVSKLLIPLILITMMGLFYYSTTLYKPVSNSTTPIYITIDKGSTLTDIANLLEDKGVIRSSYAFKKSAKRASLEDKLQTGSYTLTPNLEHKEILEKLQKAQSESVNITIPEGYTIQQIDDMLTKEGLIKSGELIDYTATMPLLDGINSAEGILFPDTYKLIRANFSVQNFTSQLVNTFKKRLTEAGYDNYKGVRSLQDIVIMASMIEREAAHNNEMSTISGILWKRLDEGIALGVDATTRYEYNNWNSPITQEMLSKDSDYNTRKRRGMPKTAISNPGLEALKAALYPTDSDYYYYLHDMTGKIYYGKTLDEHVKNKGLAGL